MKITIEIDVEHFFDREKKEGGFVASYGWASNKVGASLRVPAPKRACKGYGATLDEAVANLLTRVAALFTAKKVPS